MSNFKMPLLATILLTLGFLVYAFMVGAENVLSMYQYDRILKMLDSAARVGILSSSSLQELLEFLCAPEQGSALYESMSISLGTIIKYCFIINFCFVALGLSPALICLFWVSLRTAQVLKRQHAYENQTLFNLLSRISMVRSLAFYTLLISVFWLNSMAPLITAGALIIYLAGTTFVVCYRRFTPF